MEFYLLFHFLKKQVIWTVGNGLLMVCAANVKTYGVIGKLLAKSVHFIHYLTNRLEQLTI